MHAESLYALMSQTSFTISTDTRTIAPGDIYIGIRGETFDGNAYASDALAKGAQMAIIDNPAYQSDERCILVADTRKTLEALAALHRREFDIPVVVIGGSNGKTTTKELVHAVLSQKYIVHTTKGNLNNDIGVPLTLLAMQPGTEIAVIEVGANHAGEHALLMDIISPTHVLVTNNGADHLEGFGSLAGVRAANKEIYDWAHSHHAHAFVNNMIEDLVEDSTALERTLYPTHAYKSMPGIYASLAYDGISFSSSLFGSYNEPNMLAAIAIGTFFDVPLKDIQEAIRSYLPTLKRSEVIEREGYTVILDCYNANPTSMELALRDFFATTEAGTRIILIGDMLEMGDAEAEVHQNILALVQTLADPADTVCVGPRFGQMKAEFPFVFFETAADARPYFNTLSLENKKIFVKASRGIKLETVLQEKIPIG